jgi:hypothetical protein
MAGFHPKLPLASQPLRASTGLLNIAMMSRILAVLVLFLSSCSAQPDAKANFTKVTRISLCEAATVHNVKAGAADASIGRHVYVADVRMPDSAVCDEALFGGFMKRVGGGPCAPTIGCSGRSPEGEFYRLDMAPTGWRVTYSK